ncbi:hypothetical protein ILYODFUR_005320 [Ilyodon furcidens]|uniref:Uncharacterized protein n=1 Tax=Ilyodon furcidens TaxID=33524 RepID=A0ABV0URI1_9TELE
MYLLSLCACPSLSLPPPRLPHTRACASAMWWTVLLSGLSTCATWRRRHCGAPIGLAWVSSPLSVLALACTPSCFTWETIYHKWSGTQGNNQTQGKSQTEKYKIQSQKYKEQHTGPKGINLREHTVNRSGKLHYGRWNHRRSAVELRGCLENRDWKHNNDESDKTRATDGYDGAWGVDGNHDDDDAWVVTEVKDDGTEAECCNTRVSDANAKL